MKPTWFSKPIIDPVNTLTWFLMDALWMLKLAWPAYIAAGLTVITGVMLLILDRREDRGTLLADLGLGSWIVMNTVWLVYDLNGQDAPYAFAIPVSIVGTVLIIAAIWHSKDIRRLRIFQRR